jgi:hypothetical protein
MNWLKRHPFPVSAHFKRVVAVSFAFPEEILIPLISPGLEIDPYEGLGFVTVAMVWTKDLRPSGLPRVLGQDFFLAGYRIFTKLRDETGRRLRGLKILHSETDKRRMTSLGNLMTGYHYRHVQVQITESRDRIEVENTLANGQRSLRLELNPNPGDIGPPAGSPFLDWRTARRFAGPMPFTFSPQNDGSFVVVEGSRASWTPRPVEVIA